MRLLSVVAGMFALVIWEFPNLKRWGSGERWAFWVAWGLMFAWAVAEQLRVRIPSLAEAQAALLEPLAKKYLTPIPNPFW